ncbi:MAG: helix-turn-helix transcriptional regulator [Chloroflexi bacterium]|nr:MAG: helix-turn-helix transcriptional regulator [Chloroflexota bacterium]
MHTRAFTARQLDIVNLIALGLCDKEIAAQLGVSYRTVRTHLERMFEEHGFRCRSEAVAAWLVDRGGGSTILAHAVDGDGITITPRSSLGAVQPRLRTLGFLPRERRSPAWSLQPDLIVEADTG